MDFLAGGAFAAPEGDSGLSFGHPFEVVLAVVVAVLDDVDASVGGGGVDALEGGILGAYAQDDAVVGVDVELHGVELFAAEPEVSVFPDALEDVVGVLVESVFVVEDDEVEGCGGEGDLNGVVPVGSAVFVTGGEAHGAEDESCRGEECVKFVHSVLFFDC